MTHRANALAAALLTALLVAAGCSLDLAKYEPKTDDQCDAGFRACGYRCVPQDDPATGCYAEYYVCNPCPGPTAEQVHMVPACASYYCSLACEAGWGDCNADPANGCETDLSASDLHCGACGHACAGCTAGVCPSAQVGAELPFTPVGLDRIGTEVFVIDQGDGGALRTAADPATPLVSGLGTVRRVRLLPTLEGFVSGVQNLSGTDYGTLWRVSGLGSTPAKESWDSTTGTVVDFAITFDGSAAPSRVAWVDSGLTGYRWMNVFSNAVSGSHDTEDTFTTLEGDPTGFWEVYGGTAAGYLMEYTSSGGGGFGGVATPTRLAAFDDGSGYVTLFSASATDGSVTIVQGSSVAQIIPGSGLTSAIDIHADADGVYWCDADAGVVRAWRASDGFVFDLARGGQPVAVTSDGSTVIWADAADRLVRRVPK